MQMQRIITLSFGIILCLNACSTNTAKKTDADVEQNNYLSKMVIDKDVYASEIGQKCEHTRQCTAPLICSQNQCIVPPAITGMHDDSTPTLEFTTQSGNHRIWLEVVNDEYTMQRGLMMRRVCLENWGMLFVYAGVGKRAFWMHNTYIPLDIIFIRRDGSVSNVEADAEPLNDIPRYMSRDSVQYVLELAAGSAEKFGIRAGTQFNLDSLAKLSK